MKRHILSVCFMSILSTLVAMAVPAKRGLMTVKQPNGKELRIQLRGDERHHIVLSEDDCLLVEHEGAYFYAQLDKNNNIVASAMLAANIDDRTSEATELLAQQNQQRMLSIMEQARAAAPAKTPKKNPGLFSTSFPREGDVKGLVVLVEYTDTKFTLSDPYDYFSRMMYEDGFNDYGATGCAQEYFREQSSNKFRPQFDVYGPITLSHNMAYYGGNNWAGNDQNPQKMAIEACQQLDAEVDFSEYDTDNDGYIDNIFVFYAGRGEASGGSANTVWPHSWEVTATEYTPYYFDGVQLDRYACSNEWEGTHPDGVGTFIHEFSHVMGLPDLYATSYTGAFTPGAWSAMDYGPYNNDGRTPPAYSIYERYALEWIEPTVLDSPKNVTLKQLTTTNTGCIIKTSKENEFFLFENRQQTGWDTYIPGHGMLVWHVDFDQSVWDNNVVNNTASHQYVDLEEADNTRDEYSRAGDAFPGTSHITSFTDDTKPSMKTWGNQKLNLPITEITETNGIIRFKVAGGRPDIPAPTANEASDITPAGFHASWSAVEGVDSYRLSVYTKTGEGDKVSRVYADGYFQKNVGNVLETDVEGLCPATEYFYEVFGALEEYRGTASNEISIVTADPTLEYLRPVALEATDVQGQSFIANWEPLEGAEAYMLAVSELVLGDCETDVCDFTGGVKGMPEGWTTNSKLTYANTAYSGEAVPALRMSTADSYLATPIYNADVESISFWHRGSSVPEENNLKVYALVGTNWNLIATVAIENAVGGVVTTIDEMPEGTRSVKIEYYMANTKGAVALDDVKVEWNRSVEEEEVADFNPLMVYDGTSALVYGLKYNTPYIYYVRATDYDLTSLVSNGVKVTTAEYSPGTEISAVNNSSAEEQTFDISGRAMQGKLPAGLYIVRQGNKAKKIIIK